MTLKEHLKQAEFEGQRVDEMLLATLIAASCVAYCCKPLLETDAMKSLFGGLGFMFQGIGSMFHRKDKKDDDDDKKDKKDKRDKDDDRDSKKDKKDDKRDKDDRDDKRDKGGRDDKDDKPTKDDTPDKKEAAAMMANLHALAQRSIDREKDENLKKTLQGQLDVARACSVDAKGEPLDYENYQKRVKEVTGMDAAEWAKQAGVKELSKEDFEKVQDGLKKELEKMSPEEREKVAKEERENAKIVAKDILKKKEELEKAQKELDELKNKMNGASGKEKEELEKQVKEKNEVVQQAANNLGTGVLGKQTIENITSATGGGEPVSGKGEPEPKPEPGKGEPEDDGDDEKEYELTHDGKPDKLIRRASKREEGKVVWCWASDRDTTVAPDQAKELLKKHNLKESLGLSEWLKENLL